MTMFDDRPPVIDYLTARGMIANLEAFKGHNPKEYSFILKAFAELLCNTTFRDLGALNKVVKAFLSTNSAITSTEIEPSITAELLADRIKPWIEDIRQKLFNSKSAPFRSASDAKKWLDDVSNRLDEWHKRVDEWRREVDEWHKRVDAWRKAADEFHTRYQAILEEYPHISGGIEEWLEMKKQGIEVEFPPEDDWQKLNKIELAAKSLEAKIGKVGEPPEQDNQMKTYDALMDAMLEICKVANFTWESLEMYILADAPPELPLYTFSIIRRTHSLPSGASVQNRFAKVTIQGELTFEDLRSLYRRIRQELGIKHLKKLKPGDIELCKMVEQRGGVPEVRGEVGKFWESIRGDWNKKHPEDRYETWKGVQSHYKEIITRFERMIGGKAQNEGEYKAKNQE